LSKRIALLDYVFLLRPTLFYPIWTYFLAGYYGGIHAGQSSMDFPIPFGWLWVGLALSAVMGVVFILNQTQDIESDRANGKLFLLTNDIISVRTAYIEAFILLIIGLVTGFLIHWKIGLGCTILLLLSAWLYNFPPAIWKDRPIMGIITNATGGLVIYCMGWITGGGFPDFPLRVFAYTLAGAAVFLNTTLPDIEGDEIAGKITFGVKYGVGTTAVWALILETLTVLLAALFKDWFLLIPAAAVFPLFVWGAFKQTVNEVIRATKFSVLALAAAVCIVFPMYLIPVFFVFFFTKWYYKKRFNFNYPSFKSS
jgi:4-hydroxybenzoate polyprenyltransferase